MTLEAWMLIIVAIFGSNGLMLTLTYIMRQRSDVQKIKAEDHKDARIKELEIQLERVKLAGAEKKAERVETGELQVTQKQLLYMLGQASEDLREERKQREQQQATDERNYQTLKSISDRNAKEIYGLVDGFPVKFADILHDELITAVDRSQRMSVAREVAKVHGISVRFPPEDDKNWKHYKIENTLLPAVNIKSVPLFLPSDTIYRLLPGDKIWMIDERFSTVPEWCPVRPFNDPDIKGWIECKHLTLIKDATAEIKAV